MWTFVESNYFAIAREVYKKTQEYNVPKKELLLEMDFSYAAEPIQGRVDVSFLGRIVPRRRAWLVPLG
jgi:hypothetical protein